MDLQHQVVMVDHLRQVEEAGHRLLEEVEDRPCQEVEEDHPCQVLEEVNLRHREEEVALQVVEEEVLQLQEAAVPFLPAVVAAYLPILVVEEPFLQEVVVACHQAVEEALLLVHQALEVLQEQVVLLALAEHPVVHPTLVSSHPHHPTKVLNRHSQARLNQKFYAYSMD